MIEIVQIARIHWELTMCRALFLALWEGYLTSTLCSNLTTMLWQRESENLDSSSVSAIYWLMTLHSSPNLLVCHLPVWKGCDFWMREYDQNSLVGCFGKVTYIPSLPLKTFCSRSAIITVNVDINIRSSISCVRCPFFLLSTCLHPTLFSKPSARHTFPGSSPTLTS